MGQTCGCRLGRRASQGSGNEICTLKKNKQARTLSPSSIFSLDFFSVLCKSFLLRAQPLGVCNFVFRFFSKQKTKRRVGARAERLGSGCGAGAHSTARRCEREEAALGRRTGPGVRFRLWLRISMPHGKTESQEGRPGVTRPSPWPWFPVAAPGFSQVTVGRTLGPVPVHLLGVVWSLDEGGEAPKCPLQQSWERLTAVTRARSPVSPPDYLWLEVAMELVSPAKWDSWGWRELHTRPLCSPAPQGWRQ